jgi:hypothetical protein
MPEERFATFLPKMLPNPAIVAPPNIRDPPPDTSSFAPDQVGPPPPDQLII